MGTAAAPATASACVTLRGIDGQVVARAEAIAGEGTGGQGVIEEAIAAAMEQAEERSRVSNDALWAERMREYAKTLRLTLEMGGLAVPVDVESFEQAALMVSPGVGGVGARVGSGATGRVSLMYPSVIVATGMDAGAALSSAGSDALEQGDAALAGASALQERGVRFLAFESVWVTELGEDRIATFLHRGGRVFETRDVSTAMVRELGERLAGVLEGREVEDGSAASMGAALSAYALARWGGVSGGTQEQREVWTRAARAMLARASGGMERVTPGAAALWEMTGLEAGAQGDAEVGQAIAIGRGRAGQVLVAALAAPESLPPAVAAMAAWAGAGRAGALGDMGQVERADAALRSAYARTPAGEWVGLMPWAGWAEQEIASARRRVAGGDGALGGAAALREIRDVVWKHQVGATDVMGQDRDLVGGIVFTRGRQPLPTWHSLRPLAYLATMLGDERLTPAAEFPGQVLRMLASLRFLRQLCADEAVMTWGDGPAWGVRGAVWTDEQPGEATAMGLLVLGETVRSLEAVQRRRAGGQ